MWPCGETLHRIVSLGVLSLESIVDREISQSCFFDLRLAQWIH